MNRYFLELKEKLDRVQTFYGQTYCFMVPLYLKAFFREKPIAIRERVMSIYTMFKNLLRSSISLDFPVDGFIVFGCVHFHETVHLSQSNRSKCYIFYTRTCVFRYTITLKRVSTQR